jgi:hypothetical protein
MILVRDVFQLRFGAAREAVALWREGLDFVRQAGGARDVRLLTDLAGPYYTLVLETTYDNLTAFDREMHDTMGDERWRAWYARFVPLVQSGHREMFTIVGAEVPPLPRAAERERRTAGADAVRLE